MQTFLPNKSFRSSAACLDRQRLGKQRVEGLQIMKALATGEGWANHPCTKMWQGHEGILMDYVYWTCLVWRDRGYKDTCYNKVLDIYQENFNDISRHVFPKWFGDEDFHNRHKSMLLQKNYDHYSQFGWDVPLDMVYKWWCPDRKQWYELYKKGSKNIKVWL